MSSRRRATLSPAFAIDPFFTQASKASTNANTRPDAQTVPTSTSAGDSAALRSVDPRPLLGRSGDDVLDVRRQLLANVRVERFRRDGAMEVLVEEVHPELSVRGDLADAGDVLVGDAGA